MIIDATFWVAVSFLIFIGVLVYLKVPQKIDNSLNEIIKKIKGDLDNAEKLKDEAKTLFSEARKKVLSEINVKKETLENEINKEIKIAEKEIIEFKNNAPEKVNKIAIETSKELVKELIDAEVNNSNISAIVEDLSKRNKDKYYDV